MTFLVSTAIGTAAKISICFSQRFVVVVCQKTPFSVCFTLQQFAKCCLLVSCGQMSDFTGTSLELDSETDCRGCSGLWGVLR